jgi:hypothetical protein
VDVVAVDVVSSRWSRVDVVTVDVVLVVLEVVTVASCCRRRTCRDGGSRA